MAKEITFEEILAAAQSINPSDYAPGGRHHMTAAAISANPGAVLKQVCDVYKAIRPILQVLANLPLLPAAVRAAITAFMGVLDSLCP